MDIACAVDDSAIVYFMNERTTVEVLPSAGLMRLVTRSNFYPQLLKMFPERKKLLADNVTDGERSLGCINCLIHRSEDINARPALVTRSEMADVKWFFSLPRDDEMRELFLSCPALIMATAVGSGYFPCEEKEFMPIVNTS